jgi:release factor glutamine methyltransferase
MTPVVPSLLTVGQAFATEGIDRGEAGYLLRAATGAGLALLIAHPEHRLTQAQTQRFLELVRRRRRGEPVAYLVGTREFYGLEFELSPATLIPRPETELLVELALARIPENGPFRVLDAGTGSGVIGISVAALRPHAEVVAADVSEEALGVAAANARRLLRGRRLPRFVESDWFDALAGERFDLIVSNPPYVAANDPHLEQGDLRFEPRAALVGGSDGLDAIRLIVAQAPAHLNAGGWLLFEHGHDQAQASITLLEAAGFSHVFDERDLAGMPRVAGGRWPGSRMNAG